MHFATHQTETLYPSMCVIIGAIYTRLRHSMLMQHTSVPVPAAGTGDREGLVVGLDPPHVSDGPSRRLPPM